MEKTVEVSIICCTYNHEKYIRKALEGFISQKTSFKYEVLIHDDASTDNTAEIIREYEKKYPEIIRPIYQTENQYSKEVSITEEILCPKAKGKYIALCEGDDYWTDPYKLQKQFDALEKHPEIDICAHSTDMYNEHLCRVTRALSPSETDIILPVDKVILGGGGYVGTCSLFLRRSLYDNLPAFMKFLSYDYTTQIYGALRGGMLYLAETMSVYRYLCDNSWTSTMPYNINMVKKLNTKLLHMYELLDEYTEGKYSDVIANKILSDEFNLYVLIGPYKLALDSKFKEIHKKQPFKLMLKLRIKATFPILLKLKNRIIKRKIK